MVSLDPKGTASPAGQVCAEAHKGSFNDSDAVYKLAMDGPCDVVTVEIEHISTDGLKKLEDEGKVAVQPSSTSLALIQDKYRQKVFLNEHKIPLGDYVKVSSLAELKAVGGKFGFPFMLKTRRLAYDGRGNAVVRSEDTLEEAFASLGGAGDGEALYAERWVEFTKELAVMVARSSTGEVKCYPVVETVQRDNICHTVTAPARVSEDVATAAQKIASDTIQAFSGAGIFGVEMFWVEGADTPVLLNEIAPRPHNSGHYTMEACVTDQFEQHLRAVLGMPLGDTSMRVGCAVMVNILGEGDMQSTCDLSGTNRALAMPGAAVHWYGKDGCKKGRKVGHLTITANDFETLDSLHASLSGTSGKRKADAM